MARLFQDILHRLALGLGALGICVLSAGPASASGELEFNTKISLMLVPKIDGLVSDPAVIEALRRQNVAHASLTEKQILKLDRDWRNQRRRHRQPLIAQLLGNDVSRMLREYKQLQGGQITEIFIMDRYGLNVALSDVTTDYWQGDESKFQDSFGLGSGAVAVGALEYDDSTQIYQIQVSLTIDDPDTREPIGAITIGIDVDRF